MIACNNDNHILLFIMKLCNPLFSVFGTILHLFSMCVIPNYLHVFTHIRVSVDSLCRDGADMTCPLTKMKHPRR